MHTPVTIETLPPPLQNVPTTPDEWLRWRDSVIAWRTIVHEDCRDPHLAANHYQLAAEDHNYYRVMFCPIYESRQTIDFQWDKETQSWVKFVKPPGWYPWIPFPFQVDFSNFIFRVKSLSTLEDTTGKGDAVVEKSREMGASWDGALAAAHDFQFNDNQDIGVISYKEEVVDNGDDPKSIFFKIRSLIGIYDKVPARSSAPGTMWHDLPTRVPDFFVPHGFNRKDHNRVGAIYHPTKNNSIVGNTTSSKTGTGARWSWALIDEGAKNEKLMQIWGSLQAVTYHRIVVSSVDLTYGDDFYRLARDAEHATLHRSNGPSFYQLPWYLHPLRDTTWLEAERARSNLDPHQFAREYEMDYHAGFGDWVYPYAQQLAVKPVPYVPGAGPVAGTIDPSVSDPTAIIAFQKHVGEQRTRAFESLQLKTPSAAMLAPILMGFPPGHPEFIACPADARDFMALMWTFRERREPMEWVGDPYGNNAGGSSSETFYQALHRASIDLSEKYPELPERQIVVRYKYENANRYHAGRKEAFTNLLPYLDINDSPGGRTLLEAIKSYQYKPEDKATTERLEPVHGWGSHLTTAAEFYAVHDRALTDSLSFRRRAIPGPHDQTRSLNNRRPQKPRRVA